MAKEQKPRPEVIESTLQVTVYVDRDASVARVWTPEGSATGSSRRMPGDKFDAGVGHDLALARALENAARKLKKLHKEALKKEPKQCKCKKHKSQPLVTVAPNVTTTSGAATAVERSVPPRDSDGRFRRRS